MMGIVRTAKVNAGMRVLVHAAAGGVGSIAVQLAHTRGARVIATCSQRNLDFVRDLGAREVIAYDKTTFELQVATLTWCSTSSGVMCTGGATRCLHRAG
jgi:NADPH:quinone reductase-like Zn-dependent oxidoreductase